MKQFSNRCGSCENKKDKFNFKEKKENTVHSLFEVEHFLCDLKNVCKGFRLYNIIKR